MVSIDNIYLFVETELQKNIDVYQYLSATRLIRLQAIFSLILKNRKEVIHEQLPLPMPCYDLAFVTEPTVVPYKYGPSGIPDFADLTGSEYKIRERIHRSVLICDY